MVRQKDILTTPKGLIRHEKRVTPLPTNGEPSPKRTNSVDMMALIRSIQRVEGNSDCFRRGLRECPEMECSWRPYCLEIDPFD
jgi:hypothetical protein